MNILKDAFGNLFSFDKMITPVLIKVVYFIFMLITVLMGLGTMLRGLTSSFGGGYQVLVGLLTIVVGPIMVRIWCEFLIVLFKIHENLVAIRKKEENI